MPGRFAAGVTLTDGETMAPAGVEPLTDDGLTVQVTAAAGRSIIRIKRMFGVFDAGVNALHRESIGGVALDPALAPGQWRELTAEEVERLRHCCKTAARGGMGHAALRPYIKRCALQVLCCRGRTCPARSLPKNACLP